MTNNFPVRYLSAVEIATEYPTECSEAHKAALAEHVTALKAERYTIATSDRRDLRIRCAEISLELDRLERDRTAAVHRAEARKVARK